MCSPCMRKVQQENELLKMKRGTSSDVSEESSQDTSAAAPAVEVSPLGLHGGGNILSDSRESDSGRGTVMWGEFGGPLFI